MSGAFENSLHAGLALLAARLVLPGPGPDVNKAINLACDLVACDLGTPATGSVAALRYGTLLRDAGPVIRDMLREQGFEAAGPDASETEKFNTMLRAVAAGGMEVGEFYPVFMESVPAWERQDELQRSLAVLLHDWVEEATPEGKSLVAASVRKAAYEGLGDVGYW